MYSIANLITESGKLDSNKIRRLTDSDKDSIYVQSGLTDVVSLNTAIYCLHHSVSCKACDVCQKHLSIENFVVGWSKTKRFCSVACKAIGSVESQEVLYDIRKVLDKNGLPSNNPVKRLINPASIDHYKRTTGLETDDLNTLLYFMLHSDKCGRNCVECSKLLLIDNFAIGYRDTQRFCSIECKDKNSAYGELIGSAKIGISRLDQLAWFENNTIPWFSSGSSELLITENISVLNMVDDYKENSIISCRCNTCDYEFSTKSFCNVSCKVCNKGSREQKELYDLLTKKYGIENIEYNTRKYLDKFEIDLYLPDLKIGFEYDGLYWHNDIDNSKKYDLARERGIRLIKIFSDEWSNKRDIIESKIANIIGKTQNKIYARKCEVREISSTDAKLFYEKTHLQGGIFSAHNFGLFHEGKLVAAMSFSKPRFDKALDYELIRMSSALNTVVIGGASKLLKSFQVQYPGSIVSYSERRYGTGKSYINCGFEYVSTSGPGYFYFKKNQRFSRHKFQKHKLEGILEFFDPSLSESENMKLNGFYKIYDLGNDKYILN